VFVVPLLRLLPFAVADGPTNMAADEVLLGSAAAGTASLRFYAFSAATLSLGYFQPSAAALAYPGLAGLAWVRRPSGGAALVHHHELTYALALPAGPAWQPAGLAWLPRLHELARVALARRGVVARLCTAEARLGPVLCFRHHTPGDLVLGGHKIAGSAQRKRHGAVLQHGGILLAQSPHTPELPGLAELAGLRLPADALAGDLAEGLAAATGWSVLPGPWSAGERAALPALAARYACAGWNLRR
jgi:lipoate-protein ligase A